MGESIRTVDYFYMESPDQPGEAARVLDQLRKAGVNLLVFSGFPAGRKAQLDFVPENSAAFRSVAKAAKWKLNGPKKGFLIQGDDRVGAVADILGRLAAAKVNVTARTCTRPSARATRRSSGRGCAVSPSHARLTRPWARSWGTTHRAVLAGIAKLMPWAIAMIAVLIPTT